MHDLRGRQRKLIEIFAIERVDQVELASLETQHLHIAIGLNVELDGVEVRQLSSLRNPSSNNSDYVSATDSRQICIRRP